MSAVGASPEREREAWLAQGYLSFLVVALIWLLAGQPFLLALALGGGAYLGLRRLGRREGGPAKLGRAAEVALILSVAASGALLGWLAGWPGAAIGALAAGALAAAGSRRLRSAAAQSTEQPKSPAS